MIRGDRGYGVADRGFELPRPEPWRNVREREGMECFVGERSRVSKLISGSSALASNAGSFSSMSAERKSRHVATSTTTVGWIAQTSKSESGGLAHNNSSKQRGTK